GERPDDGAVDPDELQVLPNLQLDLFRGLSRVPALHRFGHDPCKVVTIGSDQVLNSRHHPNINLELERRILPQFRTKVLQRGRETTPKLTATVTQHVDQSRPRGSPRDLRDFTDARTVKHLVFQVFESSLHIGPLLEILSERP